MSKNVTKKMIIDNYNKEMLDRDNYSYNERMGYLAFKKEKGSRYYLYPTYMDITDYFTNEEIIKNFYIGDLFQLDFDAYPDDDPKKYFGDEWNEEYGLLDKWKIKPIDVHSDQEKTIKEALKDDIKFDIKIIDRLIEFIDLFAKNKFNPAKVKENLIEEYNILKNDILSYIALEENNLEEFKKLMEEYK